MSEVWSNGAGAADDEPHPPNGVVTVPAVDVKPAAPPSLAAPSAAPGGPGDNPMAIGGPGAVSASGAAGQSLLGAGAGGAGDVSIAIRDDDKRSDKPAAAAAAGAGAGPAAPGGPGGTEVSIAIAPAVSESMRPPALVRLTSAQASLKVNLSAMGFGADIIERAIVQSGARTVEQAVEAIFAIMSHGDAPVVPVPDADVISAQRANHAAVLGVLSDPTLNAAAAGAGAGAGAGGPLGGANDRIGADLMPVLQKQLSIKAELLRQNLWECSTCTYHNALRRGTCEMCNGKRPADIPDPNANANANGAGAGAGGGGGAAAAVAPPRAVELKPKPVDGVTCNICFEEVERKEIVNDTPCGHAFCSGCWRDYLNAMVRDGKTVKVRCPDPRCKREVTEDEFRARISPELRDKFARFHEAAKLALNPNVRWCPTPGCEQVLHGSKAAPRLKCNKCQKELCFNCAEPWHGTRTCEEAADALLAVYTRSANVKLCPKCKVRIERTEGCNHMTCGKCQYQFCWMCLGKYTSNHFEPWNLFGCPGLQSNSLTFLGDDRCCGLECGCGCGVCGFFKRWAFRLLLVVLFFVALGLALGVGLPIAIVCCPCIFWYNCLRDGRWRW